MRTGDLLVAGALVLLHLLLHLGLGVGAGVPDLFTLAVLVVARECHEAAAAFFGLLLGLLEDAQGLLSFGSHGLALALVGALAARTRDLFVGDSLLFAASYLFLGKLLRDLIHWVAVGPGGRLQPLGGLLLESAMAAAYMTVVGLILIATTGVLRRQGAVR
ncbi:MAG: hypothetical protein RQ751_01600 [Longimicrobiales bacterium]|nr:hypothetical protein [Longimicrobiales bacterium]